ncbi:hypothetical protein Pla108_40710 [Botrimarina colliarenosi]|uniref:Peptidase M10 metallopeptidase domain-containing protein n=1 Tax=Botrimarina colliarenosi TaxID=2528001 RepID=A0A5C6A111_9BACT|nr:hypothetical protein [Botrimarina colliarenosi]TWT92931.1 hypothetical protein Pla108_40710 [Botrimarina colliarenosi]
MRRTTTLLLVLSVLAGERAVAVSIVLDYALDAHNENWFDPSTPDGRARRLAVNAAADLLSVIITNDDWAPLSNFRESITFTDIAAATIRDLDGGTLIGTPESDGRGYSYSSSTNDVDTTNRGSVDANEYVIYVGAFAFDSAATANAKAGWDSNDRRNAAGDEFNTWGGRVYFNTAYNWYAGQNPGANPVDSYGIQDPDKTPTADSSADNWEWSAADAAWKGFDLASVDPSAGSARDLYGTALHELMHALGATSTVIEDYVGVNLAGDFVGTALTAEHGGPVPGDGGHFAEDTQSVVWASEGVVSETLLDPNSRLGVRKHLTRLDAALLTDLGYQVEGAYPDGFLHGDYNDDGLVNAADYTVWRDAEAGSTTLANDPSFTEINLDDLLAWQDRYGHSAIALTVPVPSGALIALPPLAALIRRRRFDGNKACH